MTIKTGKTIIPYGIYPEPHELTTARFFNKLGFDVEFIPLSYQKGVHTPDIKMDGILWEIKAPKSSGKYTLQHSFKTALKQSQNVIFDLRNFPLYENRYIGKIKNLFNTSKSVKRLLVITKSLKILDFKK
jgi:hypothetical protein